MAGSRRDVAARNAGYRKELPNRRQALGADQRVPREPVVAYRARAEQARPVTHRVLIGIRDRRAENIAGFLPGDERAIGSDVRFGDGARWPRGKCECGRRYGCE